MEEFTNPDTGIFFNKLGITDAQELEQVTKDASLRRLQELAAGYGPQGDTFDAQRLRAVHHHLFQDTFEWAGQTRREAGFQGIKAADLPGIERPMHFTPFERIDERLNALGEQLKQENNLKGLPTPEAFAERAAYYFDHCNHVHAFREGNGRTLQATFVEIAYQAGYQVDFNREHEKLNPARDQGIVSPHGARHKEQDLQALRELFARNTTPLPGAEAARHPSQARPLPSGATPAVRQIEQLRELVAAAPAMQQLVAGVDYRRTNRADALLSMVLDIDRNPAAVREHGAALQQVQQEVIRDQRFQDSASQQEASRFGAALAALQPASPTQAVTVGPGGGVCAGGQTTQRRPGRARLSGACRFPFAGCESGREIRLSGWGHPARSPSERTHSAATRPAGPARASAQPASPRRTRCAAADAEAGRGARRADGCPARTGLRRKPPRCLSTRSCSGAKVAIL
jgi:fido (protein-threonine AMPylation protein)